MNKPAITVPFGNQKTLDQLKDAEIERLRALLLEAQPYVCLLLDKTENYGQARVLNDKINALLWPQTMGLPPHDENVKLRAEIEQMQLQIAALKEELRGRVDIEDRLRTALTAITQGAPFGYSAHAYEDIARNALNKK